MLLCQWEVFEKQYCERGVSNKETQLYNKRDRMCSYKGRNICVVGCNISKRWADPTNVHCPWVCFEEISAGFQSTPMPIVLRLSALYARTHSRFAEVCGLPLFRDIEKDLLWIFLLRLKRTTLMPKQSVMRGVCSTYFESWGGELKVVPLLFVVM